MALDTFTTARFRKACWWLVGLGAALTAMSFLGGASWAVELFCHFRVQYAWGFALLTVVLALTRSWKLVVAGAVLVAIQVVLIAPSYIAPAKAETLPEQRLRVVYANVNGANREHQRVLDLLRSEQADIVVIAELRAPLLDALQPLRDEGYPTFITHPRRDNYGIALLAKRELDGGVETLGGVETPPAIVARDPAAKLTVIGLHPPPPMNGALSAERDRQLDAVIERVRSIDGNVVLLGDLNMTPWAPKFGELLGAGLLDSREGFGVQTSWPASWPAPLRIPIDHCLVSPEVVVTQRRIGPEIGSDHRPIVVDLLLP